MVHKTFYIKVFYNRLQYISYKEKAGKKAESSDKMQKLTDKSAFLAKTVEDTDYKSVKDRACK